MNIFIKWNEQYIRDKNVHMKVSIKIVHIIKKCIFCQAKIEKCTFLL